MRNSSRRNSVGPRCTWRPFRDTRCDSRSSSISPAVSTEAIRPGLLRPRTARTPAHNPGERERLDHIIVGAGSEPANAVALLAARCEQDDRDGARILAGPQATAKL